MKIFKDDKDEPKPTEKQKTEESLAAKLSKLCEQPLGPKKSSVYSSGQSKLLLNVYSNGTQRMKRKFPF